MTPIADHFDMPDARQPGDAREESMNFDVDYAEDIAKAEAEMHAKAGQAQITGHGYLMDRSYAIINVIQQLDQVHRTLDHLQLPTIAAIVEEAITALGQQWLDERKRRK
jgi:hypothetical protein